MRKEQHSNNDDHILAAFPDSLVKELRNLVQTERDQTMMSMPEDRVMRALKRVALGRKEELWIGELVSWFRPVFIAGLLVIVTLAFYNVNLLSADNENQQTAAEMVLGLPPITVASPYHINLEDHP